jgi:hypothetical protein
MRSRSFHSALVTGVYAPTTGMFEGAPLLLLRSTSAWLLSDLFLLAKQAVIAVGATFLKRACTWHGGDSTSIASLLVRDLVQ